MNIEAGAGAHFDFTHGDALNNNNIDDAHKDADAELSFTGSTGKQELGVTKKFLDGSRKRLDSAVGNGGKPKAFNDHFASFDDHFKAFDHNSRDVWGLVLLQI